MPRVGSHPTVRYDVPDLTDGRVDERDHRIGDRIEADGVHLLLSLHNHHDECAVVQRVQQPDYAHCHDDNWQQDTEPQ